MSYVHTVLNAVTFAATINSSLQLAVDPQMRGRVMALYSVVFLGSTPIGGPISGRATFRPKSTAGTIFHTGPGISAEDQQHLFHRFYRSVAARALRPEGAGIGLSMAAVIARLHGATIEVTSEPGAGARFVVSFPLRSESSQ